MLKKVPKKVLALFKAPKIVPKKVLFPKKVPKKVPKKALEAVGNLYDFQTPVTGVKTKHLTKTDIFPGFYT